MSSWCVYCHVATNGKIGRVYVRNKDTFRDANPGCRFLITLDTISNDKTKHVIYRQITKCMEPSPSDERICWLIFNFEGCDLGYPWMPPASIPSLRDSSHLQPETGVMCALWSHLFLRVVSFLYLPVVHVFNSTILNLKPLLHYAGNLLATWWQTMVAGGCHHIFYHHNFLLNQVCTMYRRYGQ